MPMISLPTDDIISVLRHGPFSDSKLAREILTRNSIVCCYLALHYMGGKREVASDSLDRHFGSRAALKPRGSDPCPHTLSWM